MRKYNYILELLVLIIVVGIAFAMLDLWFIDSAPLRVTVVCPHCREVISCNNQEKSN